MINTCCWKTFCCFSLHLYEYLIDYFTILKVPLSRRLYWADFTSKVWSSLYTGDEFMALTTSRTPLKLLSSWKTCKISMIRDTTATLSSRFSVSIIHLKRTDTQDILNGDSHCLAASQSLYYFSNHSVRLVVWRIILRRFGEWSSLSSLVQTLPTNSDGCTALHTGETVNTKLSHIT